jgi:hypothetical protein
MEDSLGNKVKRGDILLAPARGMRGGEYKHTMVLWGFTGDNDGRGYYYDIFGVKNKFAWVFLEESIKVPSDIMPIGFKYAFKHGMMHLNSKIKNGTILELIENSDWKQQRDINANYLKIDVTWKN